MTAAPYLEIFSRDGRNIRLEVTTPDADGTSKLVCSVSGGGDPITFTGNVVVDTLGALNDARATDPDAASATIPALLRALMFQAGGGTTSWGVSAVPYTSADRSGGVASVTDAPTAGKKLVIDDLIVSVDTAMSVTFKCETTGAVVYGPIYMAANTTVNLQPKGKRKLATADKKLQVVTSVAGNISVFAGYRSET